LYKSGSNDFATSVEMYFYKFSLLKCYYFLFCILFTYEARRVIVPNSLCISERLHTKLKNNWEKGEGRGSKGE
jgi:hypothetical protein